MAVQVRTLRKTGRGGYIAGAAMAAWVAAAAHAQEARPMRYDASWESLARHEAAPEWLKDAKLGIYFHWGVYSVPAFGDEWYPSRMHVKDSAVYKHHLETYGPIEERNNFV